MGLTEAVKDVEFNEFGYAVLKFEEKGTTYWGVLGKNNGDLVEVDHNIIELVDLGNGNIYIKRRNIDNLSQFSCKHIIIRDGKAVETDDEILDILNLGNGDIFISRKYVDDEVLEGSEYYKIDDGSKKSRLVDYLGSNIQVLDKEEKTVIVSNPDPLKAHQKAIYNYGMQCFPIGDIWLDSIELFEEHEGSYKCAKAAINLRGGTTIKKTDPLVRFYIATNGCVVSDAYITPMGEFGDYNEPTVNNNEEQKGDDDPRKTIPQIVDEAKVELESHLEREGIKLRELKPYPKVGTKK